jgi:hypothetical protein
LVRDGVDPEVLKRWSEVALRRGEESHVCQGDGKTCRRCGKYLNIEDERAREARRKVR